MIMIQGQNAVAPSPLAEDEDTTRSIQASPRTSALRGNDGHGTCSRVFCSSSKCDIPRKEVTEAELGLGEFSFGRPRIPSGFVARGGCRRQVLPSPKGPRTRAACARLCQARECVFARAIGCLPIRRCR